MRLANCLFTCLVLLGACGDPARDATEDVKLEGLVLELSILADQPEEQEKVLEKIREVGSRDVEGTVASLLALLERERRVPGREIIEYRVDYGDTGIQRKDMLRDLDAVHATIVRRLGAHIPDFQGTFDVVGVDDEGMGRIRLKILYALSKTPEDVRPYVERLAKIGSSRGTFGLRLIVERPGGDKPSLFDGSAEQYDGLLGNLREQLKAEILEGGFGPVGEPPYLVHLAPPPGPDQPPTMLLLRAPADVQSRFDQRDLELSGFMDPDKGRHVLSILISKDREKDWAAFCKAYAGHSYALIVNGVVHVTAPVPTDATRREYNLDMGDMRDRVVGQNIVGILRNTMLGWHRREVTAEILPNDPVAIDTPVAMALAMMGEQAEPLLGRFVHESEDANLKKRVQWAREQIARRLTGQPMKRPSKEGK